MSATATPRNTARRGHCAICHRTDVPTADGRLKVHKKVPGDKGSAYCAGVGQRA